MGTGMGPTIIDRLAENGLWSRLCPSLDYVNLMTYDYNGGWSDVVGHNAPLYGSSNPMNNLDLTSMMVFRNCLARIALPTNWFSERAFMAGRGPRRRDSGKEVQTSDVDRGRTAFLTTPTWPTI